MRTFYSYILLSWMTLVGSCATVPYAWAADFKIPNDVTLFGFGGSTSKYLRFRGNAGACVGEFRWNQSTDKLQFSNDCSIYRDIGSGGEVSTFNNQTGTTYTLVLADSSESGLDPVVTGSNASPITLTVPPISSVPFATGARVKVLQKGAGPIMFDPGAGVTINSLNGNTATSGQYARAELLKDTGDTWYLSGDLQPQFITATGGVITTDGNYRIHTFTSNGTFTVTNGVAPVESLMVAGGGGAGDTNGGGGGAGGVLHTPVTAPLIVGSYPVVVGAGGAGGGSPANGTDSTFFSLTAIGGGYGGGGGNIGGNGGSGGGTGHGASYGFATGTVGQGNDGGNNGAGAFNASPFPTGGGGGAGAVGQDAVSSTVSGSGGNGISNSITGSPVTYGGGGGGGVSGTGTAGTGGTGGGGNGGVQGGAAATAGTANLGGGGGGGGTTGAAGGSGVVIIRYQFQ